MGKSIIQKDHAAIFPAQHYVTTQENIQRALKAIEEELERRVAELQGEGKVLEAQRLLTRTRYDMQMLAEVGYCSGIENYSRHLDGRNPGEPPGTLLDFFPDDFIMVIDESHITVPQIRECTMATYREKRPSWNTDLGCPLAWITGPSMGGV